VVPTCIQNQPLHARIGTRIILPQVMLVKLSYWSSIRTYPLRIQEFLFLYSEREREKERERDEREKERGERERERERERS
jgi:hypothetical protein